MSDEKSAFFTFTGDPRVQGGDPTRSCHMYGIEFPAGKSVEVKDEAIAERLRRNTHFKESGRVGRTPKAD